MCIISLPHCPSVSKMKITAFFASNMKYLTLFSTRGQQQTRAKWDIIVCFINKCFCRFPNCAFYLYHKYVVLVIDKLITSRSMFISFKICSKIKFQFQNFSVESQQSGHVGSACLCACKTETCKIPIGWCFDTLLLLSFGERSKVKYCTLWDKDRIPQMFTLLDKY